MPLNAGHQKDVEKTCTICESTFFAARCRADVAKYCSRSCYYKSMAKKGTVILKCDICSKEYRRPPSHSHYKTKTCSLVCRGLATRTEKPVSGDYPSVKSWMKRRNMLKSCIRCSYDEHPEILVIHHADRDRRNNDLSNLEILCPNCHALEHYSENKKGWGHASTKRRIASNNLSQH
jgi:hypothetical protein